MLILGLKGTNLDQKGPKWAGLDFFRTANINFLKEDYKISFYIKNQQNSMNSFVDISKNVVFGPKRAKFGPKRAQNGRDQIFRRTVNINFQKEDHKISFYIKNQQNSMNRLEHISQNDDFGPKRGKFGQKRAQNGRGQIFSRTVNINFPKEDHKISFYTQNKQSSMYCLEDISQNVDFGPKRGKFGPKRAQNGGGQIFPGR